MWPRRVSTTYQVSNLVNTISPSLYNQNMPLEPPNITIVNLRKLNFWEKCLFCLWKRPINRFSYSRTSRYGPTRTILCHHIPLYKVYLIPQYQPQTSISRVWSNSIFFFSTLAKKTKSKPIKHHFTPLKQRLRSPPKPTMSPCRAELG